MEDFKRVELALLEDPSVADCAILTRTTTTSCTEIVAYVVPGESFLPDRLQSRLKALLPTHLLPHTYVPVSSIPLTPEGQLDHQVLSALGVMDSDLLRRWEDQLRAVPGIERAAVRLEEVGERPSVSHLSDLLPGWKAVGRAFRHETAPARTASATAKSRSTARAISHGGLLEEADGPATLAEALHRACIRSPEKSIVYIGRDGSEKVQSYPDLLKAAERVLSGLKAAALKPGDKVIFQLESNQDFVMTFWGCVLGGFIPVPIAVSTT